MKLMNYEIFNFLDFFTDSGLSNLIKVEGFPVPLTMYYLNAFCFFENLISEK